MNKKLVLVLGILSILFVSLAFLFPSQLLSVTSFRADETQNFKFEIPDQVVKSGKSINPRLSALINVDEDGYEAEFTHITFLIVDGVVKDVRLGRTNLNDAGTWEDCDADERSRCRKTLRTFNKKLNVGRHNVELVYLQGNAEDSPRDDAYRNDWGKCGIHTEEMRQADESLEGNIPCEWINIKCWNNEHCWLKVNDNVIGVSKTTLESKLSTSGDTWMNTFGPIDVYVKGDSDNDGVLDRNDRCPETYGKGKFGCPLTDKDNDGVNDRNDKAPNTYGSNPDGTPTFSDSIVNFFVSIGLWSR